MAYRPPVVRPRSTKRGGREVANAQMRRKALAQALASRITMLLAQQRQQQQQPQPMIPPGVLGPPRPPVIPPGLSGSSFAAPPAPAQAFPSQGGPGWVPPSAYDWIRQPGFYDEPSSGNARAF